MASLGLQSGDSWQRWAQSTAPERDFPSSCRGISAFQRVLVVQVLRPDRLLSAMQAFVCEAMHVNSVAPPAASLQHLLEESGPHTPVLMVTTTGADPSRDLQEFAYTKVGRDKYFEVAMGGGQQEIALTTLRQVCTAAAPTTATALPGKHSLVPLVPPAALTSALPMAIGCV